MPRLGHAQAREAVKTTLAASTCECIDKKIAARNPSPALSKEESNQILAQCMMGAVGKDITTIQKAYGVDAFSNNATMRQIGQEVAGIMMQSCPSFMTLSMAMIDKAVPSGSSTTTGQTLGQLGKLQGTGLGLLEIQVGKSEKAEFVWLHRFAQSDDLLIQLDKLQGRQVRVLWQEVEVLQPGTKQYRKLREITGLELL